ncbi:MAG: hypothetical protein J6I56_05440 [Lachnospiraceae bacterium]|nr:hypothetical protein [Lachnospiraceae bacterium]
MKYGESAFDIIYLLTALIAGILILKKAGDRTEKQMGMAVLILGCGDAFHLVPRVLNYFVDADFTAALGIGKLVTSVTMTIFYVLLYRIGCGLYRQGEEKGTRTAVLSLAILRIAVCLLPGNGWLTNSSSMLWGILRNIPFVLLGILVMRLFYQNRAKIRQFGNVWLYILLSFAFYIPVAVFAGIVSMLGMLMLPKTICYMALIFVFYRAVTRRS